MKFKVGDRVRLIKHIHGLEVPIGTEGVVIATELYVEVSYPEFKNHTIGYHVHDELEMIIPSILQNYSKLTLPTDSNARKEYPLFRGCLRYFPAALAGVAKTSKLGNDKHNPGEEIHHDREKSMDHGDCILRHLIDVEDLQAALDRGDTTKTKEEVLNEVNQMVWRALAFSQLVHEKFGAPIAPGATKAETGKGK